jgi:adenylate cyclase
MALEGQGSDSAGSSAPEKPELVPPPAASAAPATPAGRVPLVELKFLEKLRRRNVGRVALLYVGICWIILEPVHVVFHMLAVPEWINRLVVVGMALGFPVAILIAWIYEVTPEGLKPSTAVDPRRSLLQRTGQRLNRAILGVLGVMVAYFLVYHFWLGRYIAEPVKEEAHQESDTTEPAAAVAQRSIAVLPFVDMSQSKDQEYLSDGLAEELLNLLAKIPELRVAARTSAFAFKNKPEDIQSIARKLHVAHVLEGSVRKSGTRVRITAQLIRADSGYHLWSETYDRTLNDLFKVQDEIAGEVVKALKISMDANAVQRAAPTTNAEAHRLLLQAQFFMYGDDRRRAASYYQQAIDLDPDFAEAWAGLSLALNLVGHSGGQDRHQVRDLALHAAERAVALDPKLADAHYALGAVRYWQDWDWIAANTEYETALSLDPGNSKALYGAGLLAAAHGRLGDALRLYEQAAARDPLDVSACFALSITYDAMGRFTEALATMRKAAELAPNAKGIHGALAQTLLDAGQIDAALAEVRKESDPSYRAYALAWIYIKLGRTGDADAALSEVIKQSSVKPSYNIATLYALRGERDQAFLWLNRAYQQDDASLIGFPPVMADQDLRNLHGDPRWPAFLRKMKLP